MILKGLRKISGFLFLLFFGTLAVSTAKAQEPEFLKQQLPEVKVKEGNITISLNSLASKFNIPLGEEPTFSHEESAIDADTHEFVLKSKTLKEVLNLIVAVNPDYTWKINNQVINFVPIDPQESYSFLNVQLPEFKEENLTIEDLKWKIMANPSVSESLKAQGIDVKEWAFSPGGESLEQKISLDLKNVTVRDIFNEMVKRTNRKHWTIGRWGDQRQYISIMFS